MEDNIEKTEQTTTQTGNTINRTTETSNSRDKAEHTQNLAVRIIWYIAGVLLVILGLRFVLSLLGANQSNGFANFIYSVSHPFVAPFFSLFSYKQSFGSSHFEIYTLVAVVVYALIAWGLAKLFTLNRD